MFQTGPKESKGRVFTTKPTVIYTQLRDPRTKLYCYFLVYNMPIFNELNQLLQANKPLIHCVRMKCLELLSKLLLKLVKPSVITEAADILDIDYSDRKNQKSREELVIGSETQHFLETCRNNNSMTSDERTEFYDAVRAYYAAAIRYIVEKFPIRDELLLHAEVVDISRRTGAKFKSIKYFTTRFPRMLATAHTDASTESGSVMDKLEMQFLLYQVSELPHEISKLDLDEAWHALSKDTRFDLLSHVMLNIMVLPHGNAESERVFAVVRKNSTVFRPNASRALLQSVLVMKTSDFNSGVPCYKHSYEAKFLKQAKSATYVGLEEQPSSSCFDQLPSLMKGVNPQ